MPHSSSVLEDSVSLVRRPVSVSKDTRQLAHSTSGHSDTDDNPGPQLQRNLNPSPTKETSDLQSALLRTAFKRDTSDTATPVDAPAVTQPPKVSQSISQLGMSENPGSSKKRKQQKQKQKENPSVTPLIKLNGAGTTLGPPSQLPVSASPSVARQGKPPSDTSVLYGISHNLQSKKGKGSVTPPVPSTSAFKTAVHARTMNSIFQSQQSLAASLNALSVDASHIPGLASLGASATDVANALIALEQAQQTGILMEGEDSADANIFIDQALESLAATAAMLAPALEAHAKQSGGSSAHLAQRWFTDEWKEKVRSVEAVMSRVKEAREMRKKHKRESDTVQRLSDAFVKSVNNNPEAQMAHPMTLKSSSSNSRGPPGKRGTATKSPSAPTASDLKALNDDESFLWTLIASVREAVNELASGANRTGAALGAYSQDQTAKIGTLGDKQPGDISTLQKRLLVSMDSIESKTKEFAEVFIRVEKVFNASLADTGTISALLKEQGRKPTGNKQSPAAKSYGRTNDRTSIEEIPVPVTFDLTIGGTHSRDGVAEKSLQLDESISTHSKELLNRETLKSALNGIAGLSGDHVSSDPTSMKGLGYAEGAHSSANRMSNSFSLSLSGEHQGLYDCVLSNLNLSVAFPLLDNASTGLQDLERKLVDSRRNELAEETSLINAIADTILDVRSFGVNLSDLGFDVDGIILAGLSEAGRRAVHDSISQRAQNRSKTWLTGKLRAREMLADLEREGAKGIVARVTGTATPGGGGVGYKASTATEIRGGDGGTQKGSPAIANRPMAHPVSPSKQLTSVRNTVIAQQVSAPTRLHASHVLNNSFGLTDQKANSVSGEDHEHDHDEDTEEMYDDEYEDGESMDDDEGSIDGDEGSMGEEEDDA
ncbi:hypothetical protein HDU93_001308 [Gonapodya sp. JEL0774]|nr:hypothetical protein HDU93_001308 [Gonapodya sp. JEL0774]